MTLTPRPLIAAAEKKVRERLEKRTKVPFAASLIEGHGSDSLPRLTEEAARLAALIGVDPDCLRPNDRLGDILTVSESELPPEFRPLLGKFGLNDAIKVSLLEILDHVEQRMRQDRSILSRPPFIPKPNNEDEWVHRIAETTAGQLVLALS